MSIISTTQIWHASVASYAGYELQTIEALDQRTCKFTFAAPEDDWKIILEDYEAGRLPLTDARSFVKAFNLVTQEQKRLRQSGLPRWDSPRAMGLAH